MNSEIPQHIVDHAQENGYGLAKVVSKEELQGMYTEVNHNTGVVTIEKVEEPKIVDPVEEAATKFTVLLPYVKKLGNAMPSQKGLTRVLHAFAEFPLGAAKPRLLTPGEQQLFHVLQEIQGAKSTVIQNILQKNMELEKLKQSAIASAALVPETGENEAKSESSENKE